MGRRQDPSLIEDGSAAEMLSEQSSVERHLLRKLANSGRVAVESSANIPSSPAGPEPCAEAMVSSDARMIVADGFILTM